MIKMIAAIGLDRSIGLTDSRNTLPWDAFQGDLERFKDLTTNGVVIMGRRTYESLGKKALPHRENIIVHRNGLIADPNVKDAPSLKKAISMAKNLWFKKPIFLIGGYRIFQEGQKFADEIDLTVLPYKGYENYETSSLIYFPKINEKLFKNRTNLVHPLNDELRIIKYTK